MDLRDRDKAAKLGQALTAKTAKPAAWLCALFCAALACCHADLGHPLQPFDSPRSRRRKEELHRAHASALLVHKHNQGHSLHPYSFRSRRRREEPLDDRESNTKDLEHILRLTKPKKQIAETIRQKPDAPIRYFKTLSDLEHPSSNSRSRRRNKTPNQRSDARVRYYIKTHYPVLPSSISKSRIRRQEASIYKKYDNVLSITSKYSKRSITPLNHKGRNSVLYTKKHLEHTYIQNKQEHSLNIFNNHNPRIQRQEPLYYIVNSSVPNQQDELIKYFIQPYYYVRPLRQNENALGHRINATIHKEYFLHIYNSTRYRRRTQEFLRQDILNENIVPSVDYINKQSEIVDSYSSKSRRRRKDQNKKLNAYINEHIQRPVSSSNTQVRSEGLLIYKVNGSVEYRNARKDQGCVLKPCSASKYRQKREERFGGQNNASVFLSKLNETLQKDAEYKVELNSTKVHLQVIPTATDISTGRPMPPLADPHHDTSCK